MVQATIRGVGEVGGAVFASTLTTIAVFFPIVFVEGVAGQVFGDMSLTVVFSLLASLAVALFLIPMLSSRQSSRFISGAQIKDFSKQNILSFRSEEKIDQLVSGSSNYQTWFEKMLSGSVILAATFLDSILKLLKCIFALFVFILKFMSLPILLIIMPFIALITRIFRSKFRIGGIALRYAENPDFFFLSNIKEIWPKYLVLSSFVAFYDQLKMIIGRFSGKSWLVKIGLVFLQPLLFIFYLFKYLFQLIVELLFRFSHFAIIAISIIIKSVFLIMKIVFNAPSKFVFAGFNWFYTRLEESYPRILNWSLANKGTVIVTMLVLFLFSVLVIAPRIGTELIPEVHQGEFNLELTLPVGTPAERTDERVAPIQEFISDQEGVNKVASVIGIDRKESTKTDEGENTAKLTVSLKRASSVIVAEEKLIKSIRSEVEIHGFNIQKLQSFSNEVEERMKEIPGLYDVKANIQRGNPEVQIIYNRQLLSRYGLNILDVASIVRNKVRGDVATEFKEEDRKIDILVRVRDEDKESIDNLRRLVINPDSPRPLPLEAVADIKVNEGPSEIRRIDQQRTAVITANISGRDLGSISEDIYQVLLAIDMPIDFTFDITGQNKEMETSLNSLMMALALAIFLVYIVMASQFESLLHPFIIIFTIPLALIGVLVFLYLFNIPASIVVFLGGIMLAGIVVNNAIVLVDYINHLRARGMEKIEAIVTAGKVRLRPIIMTTSTTVLGLLPMAIGMGDGAEIRTPMAITVIIGLITSTILTLIVIPTVYSVLDRGE
jgi:multidrug efflux pump subunit AcrB